MSDKKLPLYEADPAPRSEAYSHLLASATTDFKTPKRVREQMKGEIGPEQDRLPDQEVLAVVHIRHNLLAPHLLAGQAVPVVVPQGWNRLHYVWRHGETFACRVSEEGGGKVRLWFSEELAEREGLEEVVSKRDPDFEIIGALYAEALNRFRRTQRFWPAFYMAAN